jgi:diaminopimelate decarboxylase
MLESLRERAKRLLIERRHRANEARRAALGQRDGLPPSRWGAAVSAAGDLLIGGCAVADLAEQFGTPLLVVDRNRLETDYARFEAAFASLYPQVEIAYSYKTNPLPGALAVLHELGAAAEVISYFELWLALQLGVPPARIVLNGPGKGRDAIDLAVARGVKLINVDSAEEIGPVAAAARRAGRRQAVGVRVVTSVGWSAQFGLPLRGGAAFDAFRRLRFTAELEPIGLHVHLGTGLRDAPTYLRAVRETLDFARALRAELGIDIRCFDLGGGFAVPTVREFDVWDERLMRHRRPPAPIDPEATPEPSAYARAIVDLVRRFHPGNGGAPPPALIFEPGRAVSSSAQSLVLRVLAIKDTTAGAPAVILDGGKNLAAPLAYEWHELLPARGCTRARDRRYHFFGPLCHPGEQLFVAKEFPPLSSGDAVAVMDAGAYFVPNQTNFSQPRPAAVLVHDGRATLLRERETFEDIVQRDRLFAPAASRLAAAARTSTLRRH